jgi:hypothetical protein
MLEVVVCGGGPDLLSDLKACPPNAVKISCNHHAVQVRVKCEYCIYTHKDIVEQKLDEYGYKGERVYIRDESRPVRMFGYIGTAGVWFALNNLKADRVYIAGCDLYSQLQHKGMYCHSYESGKKGNETRGLNNQLKWWKMLLENIDVKRLRPVSGPLVSVCRSWK